MAHALYKTHGNTEAAQPLGNPGPCTLLRSTGSWLWAASPWDAAAPARDRSSLILGVG